MRAKHRDSKLLSAYADASGYIQRILDLATNFNGEIPTSGTRFADCGTSVYSYQATSATLKREDLAKKATDAWYAGQR